MSNSPTRPNRARIAAPPGSQKKASTSSGGGRKRRRELVGYLYIAPAFLVVGLFFICPLGLLIWMALNDWPLLGSPHFQVAKNFVTLVQDTTFWASFWFTAKYALVVTPAIFTPAYGLALMVNSRVRGDRDLPDNLFLTGCHRPRNGQSALG